MDPTPVSLLKRLRRTDQQADWKRFVDLYAPLIFHWGRSQGLTPADSADLVQEVMASLLQRLPEFEYDPRQRFRGWLRTVTLNKARDLRRRLAARPARSLEDPEALMASTEGIDLFEQAEYRKYLVNRGLMMVQAEFPEHAWRACWMMVVECKTAKEAARELGISENLVYVSKSRVLRRLRQELADLMD